MVVGVVYALCKKQVALAGLLYGLAVHLKIYPVIYALPLYLVMDGEFDGYGPKSVLAVCLCWLRIVQNRPCREPAATLVRAIISFLSAG